jgi:murein tripeptide amidase MpaA
LCRNRGSRARATKDAAAARALFDDASPWERDGGAKRVLWVIARQHPGETMASWWMEGFVNRLLDEEDPVSKKLLRRAVVHVVPNMNPDGSARGHLRTNALGANLNREWANPRVDYSPEVFHVRNAMDDTGVDLMLDVHGDEAEPYCFIVGGEGTPGWDEVRASTQRRFKEAYARACPDFQTTFPLEYGSAPVGNVVTAKTQVVVRYPHAIGMTLEMPFKDNAQLAQKDGWTARRSAMLGAAAIDAMLDVLPLIGGGE